MRKRLIVIGASELQSPAIKQAKELGLIVATVDQNPGSVGIPYADYYYQVSTVDEQGLIQVAQDFKADGIITLATDMPLRSLARACENLGLPGIDYETAIRATDKSEMIKAFSANAVAHPWFRIVTPAEQITQVVNDITVPCISKPVDNSGSRGVVYVRSLQELDTAIQYSRKYSRSGIVIIEEYLEGPEVSVELLVIGGEAHVLQITDKMTSGPPYFVEVGHSQPSQLPTSSLREIRSLAMMAVAAIGIGEGAVHAEIILTDRGPVMVELGARLGGDFIATHLLPLSTGVNMVKACIEISLGYLPNITKTLNQASAVRFITASSGVIRSISGVDEALKIEGVEEVIIAKHLGDVLSDLASSSDRVGAVVSQGVSVMDAVDACERAVSLIHVQIDHAIQPEEGLQ